MLPPTLASSRTYFLSKRIPGPDIGHFSTLTLILVQPSIRERRPIVRQEEGAKLELLIDCYDELCAQIKSAEQNKNVC